MIPVPRKHQLEAEQFISELFLKDIRHFALFMEQGTGKTKVIIDIAKYLYEQGKIDSLIVFSTNASKEQWIEEQFPTHYGEEGWNGFIWDGCGTKTSRNKYFSTLNSKKGLKVFAFNIEAPTSDSVDIYLTNIIKNSKGLFVVVDESTKIKNGRRKPIRGKRAGAKRTNKLLDLFNNSLYYKAILTGTPTPRSPFDLWSQFEFLKRNYFGIDYFQFMHRYGIQISKSTGDRRYYAVLSEKEFNIIKSEFNKLDIIRPSDLEMLSIKYHMKTEDLLKIRSMEKYSPYKNLDELKKKVDEVTFYVKKSDCLDIPPKTYETLRVTLDKDQKRIYEELKKNLYSKYAGEELTVTTKMVLTMRLQAISGGLFPFTETDILKGNDDIEYFETRYKYKYIMPNAKLNVLLEDLEEVNEYFIVWARFRAEIELITEELRKAGYNVEKYYGGSKKTVIDDFKAGKIQGLVMSQAKGAEALNLQIATLHYFFSNTFNGDHRGQAEDRSHRDGQTNRVIYKDLVCKGTVDEGILASLMRKENLIDYFRTRPLEEIIG